MSKHDPSDLASDKKILSSAPTSMYTVDRDSGLIRPAEQCASPNQDPRPGSDDPSLIVVHGISLPPGEFGGRGIEQLFSNTLDWDSHAYYSEIRGLRVSAHLLIRRDAAVIQFVPFNRRAWHAGDSQFRGVPCCNDYSIGIELEGDDRQNYTDGQYAGLAGIVAALMTRYPGLNARRIAGHCDIAAGRKTDPGPAFDWLRLYDAVAGHFS